MRQPPGAVTSTHPSPSPNEEGRFPNQATPFGSSAYYSLRVSPRDLRDDLAALLAWRHRVRAILEEVSDPSVARLKLQWWRDELARTFAGEARHPLTQSLQPIVARHRLPEAKFAQMADLVESQILRHHPASEADLDSACEQDLGALFELIASCHGVREAEPLRTARRLGGFCARVYLIRDSGALARRGRFALPTGPLSAEGLSPDSLVHPDNRRQLPQLLAPAAINARARLAASQGKSDMPGCIRARTRILETLLNEIERSRFDVADQRISLTPLRKLWLAWRER